MIVIRQDKEKINYYGKLLYDFSTRNCYSFYVFVNINNNGCLSKYHNATHKSEM